jgi:class 3 adenylate cyclase
MTIELNERLLDERLAALEAVRSWSPRVVSKIEGHIRGSDDRDVFRINPLAFAAEKGIPEGEAIDLFLHATALGLFEMNWLLLCPMCSGVVESFQALKGVHNHYFCNVCACGFESKLDEFIAIAFTVNPLIRDTRFHHPETLSPRDYFLEYCATTEGRVPDETPFVRLQEAVTRHAVFLDPGETTACSIDEPEGAIFAVSHESTADLMYLIAGPPSTGAQRIEIVFTTDNRERGAELAAPGETTVTLTNATDRRGVFALALLPKEFAENRPPLHFAPFLSGKRLITTQTFRALFRSEVTQEDEGIGVTDITLLFTDLKGSTALYDRIGDLNAFSLVQRHFDRLQSVSSRHNGAIIKTIGDAVMAAFMTPADAVRAALDMHQEIDDFNRGQPNKELVLKIGIHNGAAIAVTLNDRLDYFGQTVNIAARVQGLADADEIFLSGDVFGAPDVAAILAGSAVDARTVSLKGVHGDLRVHRVLPVRSVSEAGVTAA